MLISYNIRMKRKINSNQKYKIIKLYYEGESAEALCRNYHIAHSTLYKWIADHPKESMIRARLKKEKPVNVPYLMSHAKKLEAELEFLHRTVTNKIPLRERMKIIDDEYGKESLRVQCDALGVNRATYLNRKYRNKNEDAWFIKREARYTELIRKIYEESGHVYGARKITAIMQKKGYPTSEKYVRNLMAHAGLISARSTAHKAHLVVARRMREAAHSSQTFKPIAPNQVWVSDVTAVCVRGHYYFVCAYIDLFSRKVVGYRVGKSNSVQLVKRAFVKAFNDRHPDGQLIIHTDNACIYTSYSFNKTLREYNVEHSFSRPGTPHDNAVAETFFNTLKRESILRTDYPRSYRELNSRVDTFIEWYNSKRLHEHLRYTTPDAFEKSYKDKSAASA